MPVVSGQVNSAPCSFARSIRTCSSVLVCPLGMRSTYSFTKRGVGMSIRTPAGIPANALSVISTFGLAPLCNFWRQVLGMPSFYKRSACLQKLVR
jgi:hypothetical protein